MDTTPTVINSETRGDTTTEATIPPGIMVPSENKVRGLEKIWAPTDALTEVATGAGKKLCVNGSKNGPNRKIPARAKYDN